MPDQDKLPTLADLNANSSPQEKKLPSLSDLNKGLKKKVPTTGGVESQDLSQGVLGGVLTEELVGSTSGLEPSTSESPESVIDLGKIQQSQVQGAQGVITPVQQQEVVPVSELGETLPPVITGAPPEGDIVPEFNEDIARQQFEAQDKILRDEAIRKKQSTLPRWMGLDFDPETGGLSERAKGIGLKGFVSTGSSKPSFDIKLSSDQDESTKDFFKLDKSIIEVKTKKEPGTEVSFSTGLEDQFFKIKEDERHVESLKLLSNNEIRAISEGSLMFESEYFGNADDLDRFETESKGLMTEIRNSLPEELSDFEKEKIINGIAINTQEKFEQRKAQVDKDRRMIELQKKAGIYTEPGEPSETIKFTEFTASNLEGDVPMHKELTDDENIELHKYLTDRDTERGGYLLENRAIAKLGQENYDKRVDDYANSFYSTHEIKIKELYRELNDLYDNNGSQQEINDVKEVLDRVNVNYNAGPARDQIYDPLTGGRIGVEEASPAIVAWNKRANVAAIELSGTNTEEDLKALKSRYYANLKYLENQKFVVNDDAVIEARMLFSSAARALDLNASITTVERNAWERVTESATEAMGFDYNSDEDIVHDFNAMMGDAGLEMTEAEKDRIEQRFVDKLGSTVGGSIPVMIEIMFWTAVTEGVGFTGALEKGLAKLGGRLATGEKSAKMINGISKVVSNAANREIQFQLAGETGGAGESLGAELGTALGGNLSFLGNSRVGRIFKTFFTQSGRAAGETIEEYSGELWSELMKGEDFKDAMGTVIGDDPFEKLALTYITGAIFASGKIGTDFKNSKIVQEMEEAIRNSDSDSPIVKEAKALEAELNKPKKVEGEKLKLDFEGEDFIGKKGEVSEDKKPSDIVSVEKIAKADTEYKIGEDFFSEKEIKENLEDPKFVEKVKSGEVDLNVTNPSAEIETALQESGLIEKQVEDVKEEIIPKEEVVETLIEGEQQITEPTEGKVETKIEEDAKDKETKIDETKEAEVLKESVKSTKEKVIESLEKDLEGEFVSPEAKQEIQDNIDQLKTETETEARKIEKEAFEKEAISRQVDEEIATIKGDEKQHLTEEVAKEEAHQQQLDEEAELKYKEIENSNEGVIAKYLQGVKIDTENVKKETGGKVGVGKDINPKWVKKGAKSIEKIAEDILADELVPPGTDMQDVRNIIIDIIKHGSAKSYLESIGGVKPVKTKTSKTETKKAPSPTKVEKIPETKLKSAAEFVRSKKFSKSFDDMSRLSSLPVDILFKQAVNTSLEVVASSLEAASTVSVAIGKGVANLKETEWYKQLSDNGKKTAEEIFTANAQEQFNTKSKEFTEEAKDIKVEKEETPISKQTSRAAEMETDPEVKKKLKNIGKFTRETHEEVSNYVDAMIEAAGAEGAIINVRESGTINDKIAVLTEAGAVMVQESKAQMKEAIKNGDEEAAFEAKKAMERGYGYINEASQFKTKAGQIISYTQKSYKKHPSVFMVDQINKFEGSNKGELEKGYSTDKDGNIQTAKEAIQEVQENLSSKIEEAVAKQMENILNKIEILEEQNKDLTEELKKAKIKESKERKENKVKKAKTKRKNALDALRKASKGKGGEMSAGIIPLTNAQMEAIKDIIVSYIQEGAARTDLIVSKVYNDVKGIVNNKSFSKDHIRNIADQITEFNAQVQSELENGAFEEGDLLTEKKLTDIVKNHYKGKNSYSRTLAQAIMSKTGLDKDAAESIAESIGKEMQPTIEALVQKELKSMLSKEKTVADLKESKKKGDITPEEEADLDKRLNNSENQKIQNKIAKAINLGALSSGIEIQRAFEGKFGFKSLPETVKNKLLSISDRLADIETDTQENLFDKDGNTINDKNGDPKVINTKRVAEIAMLQKEFNTLLESQEPWSLALFLKESVSFQYIAMLSGPLTLTRAFIGGYGSGIIGTISYNLRNLAGLNIKALGQGYKAAFKSLPAAWARARVARKTGYDFFGSSAYKGGISSSSKGRVEKALFEGLGDAINEGKIGKAAGKGVAQMLKAIHALGAMDAFMVTISGSFVGATEEYKAVAKKQKGKESMNVTTTEMLKNKKLNEAAYEKIASDEFLGIQEDIGNEVDSEIKQGKLKESRRSSEEKRRLKKKMGVLGSVTASPKATYMTNRIQELREADMEEYFVQAVDLAKDATMMGEPDGVTGLLVSGLKKGLSIDPKDYAVVALMKFGLNGLFKFVRITGSVINKSFNNIPVLGIANAAFGPGYNPLTGEVDKSILGRARANPLLFKQRIATNLLVTTAILTTLNEMFVWDDDDEEFVLDPDRGIDVRGFGFGGMGGSQKNKRLHEDWTNLSFSTTKDEDGNFTNYKGVTLVPELAAVAASVSSFADFEKGDANEPSSGVVGRIMSNNIKIFTESSFSSIGRIAKKFMMEEDPLEGFIEAGKGLVVDNIKPMINPAAARSVTNFIQANAEMNQKQSGKGTIFEQVIQGAYGLDYFLKGERTDLFGNKYPVESDPTRFLEIIGQKEHRSEVFEKTVGLQYKFDTGLDLKKFRVYEWDKGKTFKVKVPGKNIYITAVSNDKNLANEVLTLQEGIFRKEIESHFDKLNSLPDKESLEKIMKLVQKGSKDKAEFQILKKYKDTNKITIIE